MRLLIDVLGHCGDDPLIPNIVWENLHPMLKNDSRRFLKLTRDVGLKNNANLKKLMPRVFERITAGKRE